jgi:hypothetical protein
MNKNKLPNVPMGFLMHRAGEVDLHEELGEEMLTYEE